MKVFPAVAGPVVGDQRDGRRCCADDVFFGVEDVHVASVDPEVGQVEYAGGFLDGQAYTVHGVAAPAGRAHRDGQAVFGDVVDDSADAPDPTVGGLELREVGLPDPVTFGGWIVEDASTQRCPGLAVGAKPLG